MLKNGLIELNIHSWKKQHTRSKREFVNLIKSNYNLKKPTADIKFKCETMFSLQY